MLQNVWEEKSNSLEMFVGCLGGSVQKVRVSESVQKVCVSDFDERFDTF